MKKTKGSIEEKWQKKLKDIEYTCQRKLKRKIEDTEAKKKAEGEYEIEKFKRKLSIYYNKKKLEYDRKCKNEIRVLEGKEKREYKSRKKFNKLEFALALLQENSKLRDTNRDGFGYCCSCGKWIDWSHLQGGHRYSRWVKNICLDYRNVNAQCRTCNFTTWPRWDVKAKEATNMQYDAYLNHKYWAWTAEALSEKYLAYFKNVGGTNWDYWQIISLDKFITQEVEYNEELWATKSFYKPWKRWRELREKQLAEEKSE